METKQTKLVVEGMSCCSIADVRETLAIDGVREVDVRLRERMIVVAHDGRLAIDCLIAALEAAGFQARAA